MASSWMIEARGLRKSFGKVTVLESVDLRVDRGSMLALLGPNGSGKTTVVRILSTLLRADGGTVTIAGHDVDTQARSIRKIIGLTGQDTAVDELLTGQENLLMMGRLFRLDRTAARQRAGELLEEFDLVDAAQRHVAAYSGGMRRRLDLAVSLINRPPVLFLDEPTNGLDPTSRMAVWETIRKLMSAGTTVLLTTQYLEEADQLANRIAVLDDGRVIAEGTAQELKRTVGAERIELTIAAADLAKAHVVCEVFDGERVDDQMISVSVDGVHDIRFLLNRVAEAEIDVRQVSLHQPTLDDVFRTLTDKTMGSVK